ncbi:protein FAR1-RELATED SEQUENCE 5-like [Juglans microcarpa x Juglans regia]|uniref:protein FAR1-RELATED SEQUENCE 5-like n=1 Tax=Juglans microcarpa x Juglans regia TaxID=2249226 RepID=UPI001B7DBFD2|nr:protein FAR1-RELATED SEQUENCE 5-like [Juglans microcarpa x Juglans regia]
MKNATALVFPKTRHRFCLWHILKKLPEKLDSHGAYKDGLKSQLLKCVYDSQIIEEFESCWEVMITTYNLQENACLQSLYTELTYWALVFLKEIFWAGMSITQRSESMNAFFDGYVHARTNLKEFVDQFDNALRMKIENENAADFHSFNVTISAVSISLLEKIFQATYTNFKFREVQKEVVGMLGVLPTLYRKDDVIATYHVEDEIEVDDFIKEVTQTVYFNEAEVDVKCQCSLFEMRWILCRHALAIMRVNKVKNVPEKYILDRWRKDIKRTYSQCSTYDSVDVRPEVSRYSHILKVCYDVATNAASCDEHADDMIDKLHAMNIVYCTKKSPQRPLEHVANTVVDASTAGSSKKVLSPLVVRGKGRSPCLRKKSIIERVKPTVKKTTQKGKRKQPHGRDIDRVDTCRNLFGQTVVGTQESVVIQPPQNTTELLDFSETQLGDGRQPELHKALDGTQDHGHVLDMIGLKLSPLSQIKLYIGTFNVSHLAAKLKPVGRFAKVLKIEDN